MKEKREVIIQDTIRLATGNVPGLVLWRNNVGVARHFNPRTHRVTSTRYGLAKGSADLVGILNGRFIALEIKRPGQRPTRDQQRWLELVRTFGGFAAVVTSVEEALAAIERARNGEAC
jgi:hypothetical protein